MNIYIDEYLLDHLTLEDEKTVGEVYLGLLEWLQKNELFVLQVIIDDVIVENFSLWQDKELEGIKRIQLKTCTGHEMLLNFLHSAILFLSSLKNEQSPLVKIKNKIEQLLTDVREAFLPYELEKIRTGFIPFYQGENLVQQTEYSLEQWLDDLFVIFEQRYKDFEDLQGTISTLIDKLKNYFSPLENLATLYQNQQDDQAYNLLERFITDLDLFMFLSSMDKTEREYRNSFFKALTIFLKELEEAYKNKDIILIADLINYEVLPLLHENLDKKT